MERKEGEPGKTAALYLRLSKEDGDRPISESIQNQRLLLERFALEKGYTHWEVYTDDGYSGLNFDRPGFRRMEKEILAGRIGAVLVKDLSRLGRDYILTGHYLERFFPLHGVRFLSCADSLDSASGQEDFTPFRSLLNDLYARDISKKVRSALDAKRREGKFIGAAAPYGYQKSASDHNLLEPDPGTAPYVRLLYTEFLKTGSLSATARRLTSLGIPTPSAVQGKEACSAAWNGVTVRRILTSPTYLGSVTQNRSRRASYKLSQKAQLPASQWMISENTHPALVTREEFSAASELLSKRSYLPRSRTAPRWFSGLAFCGDCGAPMTLSGGTYLVCSGWKRKRSCPFSHSIREDAVSRELLRVLNGFLEAVPADAAACPPARKPEDASGPASDRAFTREKERCEAALCALYKDRAAGLWEEEEFQALCRRLKAERDALSRTVSPEQEPPLPKRLEELSREAAALFIRRIEIRTGGGISVHFSFPDPSAGENSSQ